MRRLCSQGAEYDAPLDERKLLAPTHSTLNLPHPSYHAQAFVVVTCQCRIACPTDATLPRPGCVQLPGRRLRVASLSVPWADKSYSVSALLRCNLAAFVTCRSQQGSQRTRSRADSGALYGALVLRTGAHTPCCQQVFPDFPEATVR